MKMSMAPQPTRFLVMYPEEVKAERLMQRQQAISNQFLATVRLLRGRA